MTVAAVIVAAGSGNRLGAGMPKALVELRGRPLVEWALRSFAEHPDIDTVVVVVPPGVPESFQPITGPNSSPVLITSGGPTRQESVDRGLAVLPPHTELVLVHDAARPLVSSGVISSVIAALRHGAEAVIPVLPVVDTIKRVAADGSVVATVDRTDLRAVQTPQGFRLAALVRAHADAAARGLHDVSDDAGLIEAMGGSVLTVAGSANTMKITTPYDLALVEHLARP
jgi:2-C-methyl-D-erythritol 4-phosphate cytidylyltransferase